MGHTKTNRRSASVLYACAAQAWPHHFDNAEGAQAFLDSFDWPDGILPEPLPGVKLGSPSSRPAWYGIPPGTACAAHWIKLGPPSAPLDPFSLRCT